MSDIAKQYPPGKEPAVVTSTLLVELPNGKELATNANAGLAHIYVPDLAK